MSNSEFSLAASSVYSMKCLQYELSAGVQVSPYLLYRFGSFFSLVFHYSKVLKS